MAIEPVAHVVTVWTTIPSSPRQMVVWDAGIETPESDTTWDNNTTNWIG